MTTPLVRADCKIVETSLHAAEGSPAYTARAVFQVLDIVREVVEPVLLLGTYRIGDIWRSENDGESWSYVETIVNNNSGAVTAFCSAENGWLLAGTGYSTVGGRIWISKDRSDSWTLVQRLGTEQIVATIALAENGDLLAGTYPGAKIYRSQDNGMSWSQVLDLVAPATYVMSIARAENGNLVATVDCGVNAGQIYLSTDNGATWAHRQTVDFRHFIDCNTLLLNNGWLLTSAWDMIAFDSPDIWRSVDNGVTWVNIGTTGSDGIVYGLAQAQNGNVVAVGDSASAVIWTSTDNGLTWDKFDVPNVPQLYSYASNVVVAENGDILTSLDPDHAPHPPHIWRSQDNGVSWAYLLEIPGYYYIDAMALLE